MLGLARRRGGGAVLAALLSVGAAGCFAPYEGGALLRDGTGGADPWARSLGCLDVRVAQIDDPAADPGWRVVGVDMGNRCDAPVHVDLRRVVVTGRLADGRVVRMNAHDPRAEIDAAVLDGRMRAREVIAYVPPIGTAGPADEICVDVGGITGADPVPPVCFGSREGA